MNALVSWSPSFVDRAVRARAVLLSKRTRPAPANFGDMLQAACADAVRALFIFLHLLERQAECIAQIRLGHIKHHTSRAHPTPDMFVS
jgi:hypothetical protein